MTAIKLDKEKNLIRWRLILGNHAEHNEDFSSLNMEYNMHGSLDSKESDGEVSGNKKAKTGKKDGKSKKSRSRKGSISAKSVDETLAYLYDREYDLHYGETEFSSFSAQLMQELSDYEKSGSSDSTRLFSIPEWINNVKSFFPKETQEILINDAIKRYELKEILTDPRILKDTKPSYDLTKLLLSFRDHLSPQTLEIAKILIQQTVKELQDRLKREFETAIVGRRNRFSHSPLKIAKNLDMHRTVRHNLKYMTKQHGVDGQEHHKMIVDRVFFNSRVHKKEIWNIIIAVDQSGSMLDSVIHSSIIASIFAQVSSIKTNLIVFDTEVVDLTHMVMEPVEVLMSVQLGGGTDIGKALSYISTLVSVPKKTIVILITDFYEGTSEVPMLANIKSLHESGVTLLGLTAIDDSGTPDFCKPNAERCAELGMQVLSVTPKKLAELIGTIIEQ